LLLTALSFVVCDSIAYCFVASLLDTSLLHHLLLQRLLLLHHGQFFIGTNYLPSLPLVVASSLVVCRFIACFVVSVVVGIYTHDWGV
jgi:hypothetical protein